MIPRNTVAFPAQLAAYNEDPGTRVWVISERAYWHAVASDVAASNAIAGAPDLNRPIMWQPDGVIVTLANGLSYGVSGLLLGEGSTVESGVATVAGGGGGGGTVPPEAILYSVFITAPVANSQNDVGDITVGVRVLPAPPPNATVLIAVDQVDVGGVTMVGENGTTEVSDLAIGSHSVVARIVATGGPYASAARTFYVANQAPEVAIVAPANEADATVGALAVILTVTHPTAGHGDFTVQASLDPAFVTFVTATWQNTNIWTAELTIPGEANYYVHARAFDATPGGSPVYATRHRVSSLPQEVAIETQGQTFAPQLNVATGATILWEWSDSTTSNSGRPNKDFGTVAERTQYLTVTPSTSYQDLNFGFSQYDDAGRWYQAGAAYDLASQNVTQILGMGRLALGLRRFMAAHSNFEGLLDFTGFAYLEDVELFQSYLPSINLTDCTSLIRLCVEQTSLTALDISPCAGCLVDLRAAAMRGGALTLTMGVMLREAHWCARSLSLTVITPPGLTVWDCLPVVEEIWCFNTLLTINNGILAPISPYVTSIQAQESQFRDIRLAGLFPAGRNAWVWLSSCQITALTLESCPGLIELRLDGCNMSMALVDYVLTTMNSFGTSNGTILLSVNSGPSTAGNNAALALEARGWTVTREATVTPGVNSDTFTRADGPVGNGWMSVSNSATAVISGNALSRTDSGAYRVYANPGLNLPANYRVDATFPESAIATGFVGLTGRWLNSNGVKLLFVDRNTPLLGDASAYGANNLTIIVTNGFPASWALDQDHTIGLEMNSSTVTIWTDGQIYGYAICTTNQSVIGSYYGFCGAGPWLCNQIAATAL